MGNFISMAEETVESRLGIKYGWKPDKLDHRDHLYQLKHEISPGDLPDKMDIRAGCPPVYDQGQLGSCTAQSIAGAYEFDEMRQHNPEVFIPSRLFIYYNERAMEGTIDHDSGGEIRDGMKSINTDGVCHENLWPYEINKFTEKPSHVCYDDAHQHHSIKYERLSQNLHELKHCLSEGFPFVFGFMVYQSFESKEVVRTGYMTMPLSNDQLIGGHAVMAVGYTKDHFIIRNSWGKTWGDQGYFYMPYEYILNPKLASDFWTLRKVSL